MKLEELYTELSIDPFKLIESIVHAEGSLLFCLKIEKVKYFMSMNSSTISIHNSRIIRNLF